MPKIFYGNGLWRLLLRPIAFRCLMTLESQSDYQGDLTRSQD
jgi:hypothetical protein